jgi:membrane-bound inhibitor of C-type lysozyme
MRLHIAAMVFAPLLMPSLVACSSIPRQTSQNWVCSDGTEFQTSFDSAGDTLALSFGDEALILKRVRAASGAKYSNGRTTFWSKAEEAFIELDGQIVHRECRIKA